MEKLENSDFILRARAKLTLSALPLTLDAETVQRCIEALSYTPAADVRPVVRGQWEMPKTINGRAKCRICSACGIGQVFRTNFCPSCGADMGQRRE